MKTYPYIITADGNISVVVKNKQYAIGQSHPNYALILEAIKGGQFEKLDDLVDIPSTIHNAMAGNVQVSPYGEVTYKGKPISNFVTRRILDFQSQGLPYMPLVRFLDNLMENPSFRSVEELYAFLEHGGFPITEDGHFVAYKGVNDNWTDRHTGKFDNSVGQIHEMPRNEVDDNMNNACSRGFHVGTFEYARDFAQDGRLVLVKVNPRDAVSVPLDHNCQKLRVCRYEVIAVGEGKLVDPGYGVRAEPQPVSCSNAAIDPRTGRARGPGGRFLPNTEPCEYDDEDEDWLEDDDEWAY